MNDNPKAFNGDRASVEGCWEGADACIETGDYEICFEW